MSELKPCPFCGGNAYLREKTLRWFPPNHLGEWKARIAMYYYCGKCKARGGVVTGTFIIQQREAADMSRESRRFINHLSGNDRKSLKKRAIKAWNRREVYFKTVSARNPCVKYWMPLPEPPQEEDGE